LKALPSPSSNKRLQTTKALLVLAVAALFVIGQVSITPALPVRANTPNPVVVWNQLTTTLGLAHKMPAPFLAHDYALVQVAIYDTLLASKDKNQPQAAVAAGAADQVLTYLFPGDRSAISAIFNAQLVSITGYTGGLINSAAVAGRRVGDMVIAYALTDGSTATWNGTIPTGPCIWTGTNPIGPVFGDQKTFILSSGSEFQPPPPHACGSPQDLADVQAVIDAHNSLTPSEITIVHKWADLPPPTIWNNMLNDRIASRGLNIFEAARASVYLNAGMYDAFVSCWDTKYAYWTARPFQRIPGFVPVITTPNFPSYSSGHSTVSAAAALIMGQLFPDEADFFIGQAHEAAMSRLWAGIHFPQDNNNGLACGFLIGAKVVADMQGPAHTFVYKSNHERL
jgi:membrane-associated phospholipid phosphatase